MLRKFKVEGYKNFKEKFTLDLSNIREYHFNAECIKDGLINSGIIYGKNAVGKSNLGSAIMDIKNNFSGNNLIHTYEESYLNADSDTGYAKFDYEFQLQGKVVVYTYQKTTKNTILLEKLEIDNQTIFEYNHIHQELLENNLESIQANTLNWEFVDDVPSILSYIINNTPQSKSTILKELFIFVRGMKIMRANTMVPGPSRLNHYIEEIIDNGTVKKFETFLREFGIEEKLNVIESVTGQKVLYFDHLKPIPFIRNCSSGTMSLVQLYSWQCNMEDSTFLFLDEFDAFYHHELSKRVITMFNKIDHCQTITTSHNTDLLSNKIMRPDCLFILTKNKITSLVDATARELREGHNLEKLYVSGEFDE